MPWASVSALVTFQCLLLDFQVTLRSQEEFRYTADDLARLLCNAESPEATLQLLWLHVASCKELSRALQVCAGFHQY